MAAHPPVEIQNDKKMQCDVFVFIFKEVVRLVMKFATTWKLMEVNKKIISKSLDQIEIMKFHRRYYVYRFVS